jgi:hypothetical protein
MQLHQGRALMRYLYYIAAILILATAVIVYQFISDIPSGQKNAAIVVNERIISAEEFDALKPPHDETREDFINAVVTKELMIQEAQKEGIDKEESFRRSIQNFYEQSLIKALLDRKFASIKSEVNDGEIDKYVLLADKTLDLTIYTADNPEDAKANKFREERRLISFSDLSREMKSVVILLKKDDKSTLIQAGDKYIVIKLNDIRSGLKKSVIDREEIRGSLVEEKRELQMNAWMEGLKKKATIKVLVKAR